MTVQVMPGGNVPTTITVYGRTYTCAVGSAILVPDQDAQVFLANGWIQAANAAGTTAQRPPSVVPGGKPLALGYQYFDTTLNVNVLWNGKNWVRHDTGALA